MPVKVFHPRAEPLYIPEQQAQFAPDRAGLLAHARILENGAHGVERRHAGGRRHDPDLCYKAVAHQFGKIRVKLGIDRLGGQKHQRAIGGFAIQNVFLGNVADVFLDRDAQKLGGLVQLPIGLGAAKGLVGLKREFAVDTDRPRRVGQVDKAIGAPPVRQRVLQTIAVRGQRLGHDIGQLNFTECTTGLFVAQDVLKRQNIARKLGDIILRLVDRLKPLLQIAKRLRGAPGRALQVFRHLLGNLREPLFHQLKQMRLRGCLCL